MEHAKENALLDRHRPLSRSHYWTVLRSLIVIGSLLCGPSLSYAQTDNPDADERIIFKEVVCKDVMGQSGEDRDRTISFLHGFVMGGADRGEVTIAEIIDVESVFIDMCLDNPTDLVLDVMRTAHGVRNDQ